MTIDMNKLGYEIDLLPVGDGSKSGDAILLRFGDLYEGKSAQKVVVIDGGYKCTAKSVKDHLIKYYNCINAQGKIQIDLMILTHPDVDHVGGLVELANDPDIQIIRIMMHRPWEELSVSWFKDGRITNKSIRQRLIDAFGKAYELDLATKKSYTCSSMPNSYKFGGAILHILAPSPSLYKTQISLCDKTPDSVVESRMSETKMFGKILNEEPYNIGHSIKWYYNEQTTAINETSLVIMFEYLDVKILFTGDAGIECLQEAIDYAEANGIDLSKLDIIKMPHHGSRKNITPDIMCKLGHDGTECYFSCVSGDEGHHPSKRLVNLLNQMGFGVFCTRGNILRRHHNAPVRDGYKPAKTLGYFPTMETK